MLHQLKSINKSKIIVHFNLGNFIRFVLDLIYYYANIIIPKHA